MLKDRKGRACREEKWDQSYPGGGQGRLPGGGGRDQTLRDRWKGKGRGKEKAHCIQVSNQVDRGFEKAAAAQGRWVCGSFREDRKEAPHITEDPTWPHCPGSSREGRTQAGSFRDPSPVLVPDHTAGNGGV